MKELAETFRQDFSQVILDTLTSLQGKQGKRPVINTKSLFAFASPKEFFVTVSKIGTRFEDAFLISISFTLVSL